MGRAMGYQVKAKYATNTSTMAAWDYLQINVSTSKTHSTCLRNRCIYSAFVSATANDVEIPAMQGIHKQSL